jgi:hypothetical protein
MGVHWERSTTVQSQIAVSYGSSGTIGFRTKTGATTFTPWYELWHAGNSNAFSNTLLSKLNGIEAGAQVNVGTNLGQSRNSTSYTVTSSTGNNTALAAATTSLAGVMTAADKTKLDAVGTNANRNLTISTAAPSGGANGDVWYQYE